MTTPSYSRDLETLCAELFASSAQGVNKTGCLPFCEVSLKTMKINLALKVLILFFSVHVYVFLTGLVYHLLEAKKIKKNTNVINVLDKYFYNASHGPNVRASIAHSTSKAEVVHELKNAFENDKKEEMRSEFRSLWKSYLFALTTITTVGQLSFEIFVELLTFFYLFLSIYRPSSFFDFAKTIAFLLKGSDVAIRFGFED